MNKPIFLVNEKLAPVLHDRLSDLGTPVGYSVEQQNGFANGARALISDATQPVPAALIHRLPETVGLIANIGVGFDNIDLAAARDAGIRVSNTPVVTEDTADLALLLILAACRRSTRYEHLLRHSRWADSEDAAFLGTSLRGKTLGIVGFGAIGQAVARRASVFGMRILYYGPREKPAAAGLRADFCRRLEDLLAGSDVVSLHCPLNESTRHILNAERLRQMKKDAVLVNTGRGKLIDEAALVDALAEGRLGAAGLDVYEFEPHVSDGLLGFDNVTLLPHIGSATIECRRAMLESVLANLRAYLETGRPVDEVALPAR